MGGRLVQPASVLHRVLSTSYGIAWNEFRNKMQLRNDKNVDMKSSIVNYAVDEEMSRIIESSLTAKNKLKAEPALPISPTQLAKRISWPATLDRRVRRFFFYHLNILLTISLDDMCCYKA